MGRFFKGLLKVGSVILAVWAVFDELAKMEGREYASYDNDEDEEYDYEDDFFGYCDEY